MALFQFGDLQVFKGDFGRFRQGIILVNVSGHTNLTHLLTDTDGQVGDDFIAELALADTRLSDNRNLVLNHEFELVDFFSMTSAGGLVSGDKVPIDELVISHGDDLLRKDGWFASSSVCAGAWSTSWVYSCCSEALVLPMLSVDPSALFIS
ncbi:hypothetical protein BC939DRAFT_240852 [Gamsiella multidivaricata]|uniref:uncharacterized protein n=1 Tax=Gamsiella multidivaricata TaxID=101098 RepID=UPI00221E8325|nr:uncharacterized protein BC939DRAFT_240852 [Gamsiella multidivaricata]KAI7820161.1 hypothetical protein BC939DRAFT_240852 [Gamsiella multidivaricata]